MQGARHRAQNKAILASVIGRNCGAFNVLTATNIYLRFRDKIAWRYINYLH